MRRHLGKVRPVRGTFGGRTRRSSPHPFHSVIAAMPLLTGALVIVAGTTGANAAEVVPAEQSPTEFAHAVLKDAKGTDVGHVRVRETPNGAIVIARFSGIPPGTHAFHIHEKGKCEPPFDSAGGHLNPAGKKHGFAAPTGWHAGDMPNIEVGTDKTLEVTFFVTGLSKAALLDGDGSAFVVHGGPDDDKTDPSGNAGPRIACGVVEAGAMTGPG